MKRIILGLIVCLCVSEALQAQMYDPFRKTAKPAASAGSGLRPPPPMALPAPPPITVSAVMNGKAFINGAWYRIGDRVNHHEVTYIDKNFVGLKEGSRLKMIGVGANRRVLGTKDVP